MTEMNKTTRERINHMMREAFNPYGSGDIDDVCDYVADELDAKDAEIARLTAELKRLRLKARAWDAHRHAMFLTSEQDAALLKHEFEVEDAFIEAMELEAEDRGISPLEISSYREWKEDQDERKREGYYTRLEMVRK